MRTLLTFVAPAASVAATGPGPVFDTQPFEDSNAVIVVSATPDGGAYTPSIQMTDTDPATGTPVWVDSGIVFQPITEADQQQVEVNLNGLQRYIQVMDTLSGGSVVRAVALSAALKYS